MSPSRSNLAALLLVHAARSPFRVSGALVTRVHDWVGAPTGSARRGRVWDSPSEADTRTCVPTPGTDLGTLARRKRALLWGLAIVLLSGCSVIAAPSDDDIRCTVPPGSEDPCKRIGRVCIGGICRIPIDASNPVDGCVRSDELCDGRDNDCDGVVDNGHDADGDGFTWCGDATGPGNPRIDCDDSDRDTYPAHPDNGSPGGTEMCDGADNDCNGEVDDGVMCPDGLACIEGNCRDPLDCRVVPCMPGQGCVRSGSFFRCQAGGCVDGSDCSAPQICDPALHVCVNPAQPLGNPCVTDSECASNVCASPTALGLTDTSIDGLCIDACCNDGDCPDQFVCWPAATGAKACVAATRLPVAWGPGRAGASCSARDACQSGLCDVEAGRCLGNCSSSGDCATSEECVVLPLSVGESERIQTLCDPPPGSEDIGSACFSNLDCTSGLCIGRDPILGIGSCTATCGQATDCPSGTTCAYLVVYPPDTAISLCVPSPAETGRAPGQPCERNSDCRDLECVRGRCASPCCQESQCLGGYSCRPVARGAFYPMLCTPDE